MINGISRSISILSFNDLPFKTAWFCLGRIQLVFTKEGVIPIERSSLDGVDVEAA